MATPALDSYRRLVQRLPLLQRLAQTRKLQPKVLVKVLASIEQDLAQVGDGRSIARRGERPVKNAANVVRQARASLARIKKHLGQ